ncbi:MAG: response regulator [Blastocatellia bacterium]
MKLLIAEDNADLASMSQTALADAGDHVDLAVNGIEAERLYLEAVRDGCPYDVLILDCAMPLLSGLGLAEKIRNEIGDGETRIIICTNYAKEGMVKVRAKGVGGMLVDKMDGLPALETAIKQAQVDKLSRKEAV